MEFLENVFNFDDNIAISGLTDELNIFYVLEKFKKKSGNLLILTSSTYEANKVYERLSLYTKDAYLFPMDDFISSVALAISPEFKIKRLEVLEKIKTGGKCIVVTDLMGYLRFLPSYNKNNLVNKKIKVGEKIGRQELIDLLDKCGYIKEPLATSSGEFAIRGFIIDVFIIEEEHPIRIEFFDNVIESIRYFDENTQLSKEEISEISIKPFAENLSDGYSSLFDWLEKPTTIIFDYNQIKNVNLKLANEIIDYNEKNRINKKHMFDFSEINPDELVYINTFESSLIKGVKNINYNSKKVDNFNMDFKLLKSFINKLILDNKTVIFCLSKDKQISEIKELFSKNINTNSIEKNKINIIKEEINEGFIFEEYVVISEYDIDKTSIKKAKYLNTYRFGKKIKNFDEIHIGDYIVHSVYGIGVYNGVVTLEKNSLKKDYIQLIYKDDDKIYIPVEKINSLFKYSVKEGSKPRLNKLGTATWLKTRRLVRDKINDLTEELLKLYAERESVVGPEFMSEEELILFANDFEYDETDDQQKAIDDVISDLSKKKPMDRLLCGDVGFGKTEVAFRAAFKTIENNYQVAYLCPTTILSKQHYQNALKRFRNHPINIALLNRFTTNSEKNKILEGLKNGQIDLLIGTHRILSKDINFLKLGLLIIDEEQRFGVTHKERIKQLKTNVNVLTLSATPIPRTLKFALTGLRDLSIIDTPPVNRYPIQTYVIEENEALIKDAIYKELSRDGQAFVLYNNISKIEEKKNKLERLIPDAKIKIAHGQMSKQELENVMEEFLNKEFDVLLCTTIIETGIDISNVNTLIIYDANLFGLSQLYQIRGRVGRSDKIAYAYLMYDAKKMLNEIAIKRLQAIKEFTELGSGYKIAMRDLAIRGAGDLLGAEQAGFVDAVGIDMYLKMIDEQIKGKTDDEDEELNIIDVETHITDKYVEDESVKIEIHQKINEITDYNSLLKVKKEIEDRFGKIDKTILIYMYEEWFEKLAKKFELRKINQNNLYIELEFSKEISSKIKGEKLMLVANNLTNNFKFSYHHERIKVLLYFSKLEKHFIFYLVELLSKI